MEASRKTQAQKLAQLEVERDELLEIMVAQDGLIQAQTQTLQKAKLYGEADKAAIQAQAQKLAQMRERISTEQKNRRSEKVGRSTADNVKRINRLWQR